MWTKKYETGKYFANYEYFYFLQTNTLEFYSRYSKDALMPVICQMAKNLIKSETCGFRKFTVSKYSSHKLMKIAKVSA